MSLLDATYPAGARATPDEDALVFMPPWEAAGCTPLPATARGRIVLGLTGDAAQLRGLCKPSAQILRERELIYACIETRGNPTRDEIAGDTGIDPEAVTARLNWLSTHGIVRCWRSKGVVEWRVAT